MNKTLNKSINIKRNETQTESTKNALTNFNKDTDNAPNNNANKTEKNNKIIDIVEHIFHLNEETLQGDDLKILAPY